MAERYAMPSAFDLCEELAHLLCPGEILLQLQGSL